MAGGKGNPTKTTKAKEIPPPMATRTKSTWDEYTTMTQGPSDSPIRHEDFIPEEEDSKLLAHSDTNIPKSSFILMLERVFPSCKEIARTYMDYQLDLHSLILQGKHEDATRIQDIAYGGNIPTRLVGDLYNFAQFISFYYRKNGGMDDTDMDLVTRKHWTDWISSDDFTTGGHVAPPRSNTKPTPTTAAATLQAKPYRDDPVAAFKRSIKHDKNNYPKLENERGWDNYHREVIIQALADDMPNVVDENYNIQDDPNPELFHVQNRFFFSVLSNTLKTDRGKTIIREFARDAVNGNFDGRGAFLALKKVMKSGNKGKFHKRELKRYLWSAVFRPSSNITAEAFLLNIKDKMRQLEEYESHPIDEEDKISIISQAI